MKEKTYRVYTWIQENISKPIQRFVLVLFALLLLKGCLSFRSCNEEPDYETMNANFIGEEVALHSDNYRITVIDAFMKSKISTQEKDGAIIQKEGNFVGVTLSITQLENSDLQHCLDKNDFKLKDHTGTKIPVSTIAEFIDVAAPDFTASTGEYISSNATFSTRKAVKDYSWEGIQITKEKNTVITVFFEMERDMNVKSTIMIFEVDFLTGSGKTKAATDVILFERKNPIRS